MIGYFLTPTKTSQAAGRAFLRRLRARQQDRDPPIDEKVGPAQLAAVAKWGIPASRERYLTSLKGVKQPVLVVNGSNDIVVPTVNSFLLQQNLPNAQLILYPDSSHGSQYQYPALFVKHVTLFLEG